MLNIQNNFGLNSINKISFCAARKDNYHKVTIPSGAKNILISSNECLEAYNKGGMLIQIQDKKETDSALQKKNEFISNMLMYSNLNTNGNELNLYDALAAYTDQDVVSEFSAIQQDAYGRNQEVSRYKLTDGSIIDKKLYDFSRQLNTVKPSKRGALAQDLLFKDDSAYLGRIDFGDYSFLIGRMYLTVTTNITDKEGNIVGKRYRQDGTVSNILKSGVDKGIHYNSDGTVTNKSTPAIRIFFSEPSYKAKI